MPRAGTLLMRLPWDNPDDFLVLQVAADLVVCCQSPLSASVRVPAGSIVDVTVAFHGVTGGPPKGTVPFELTTSLEEQGKDK